MNFGTIQVANIFVGALNATEAYFGTEKVWEKSAPPTEGWTKVKYTASSGLPDWEGDIVGSISGKWQSPTTQIPNVIQAEEISIGSHVTEIGSYAFYNTQIKSIDFGPGVTSIGGAAFQKCNNLINLDVPGNVLSIGPSACKGIQGLTSLTIENGVIGEYAFQLCTGLTSVTIGSGVTGIGLYALYGDTSLMSVTMTGKTISTVQGMNNYSWGLSSGCVLHCTDGDITL